MFSAPVAAAAQTSKMKPDQTRPTVLAVNDEPKVLELLTVLLEHEGYKVLTAAGGQRAL